MASTAQTDISQTRTQLAYWVLGLGMAGIALISVVALAGATAETKGETTRLIFASVLPLLGTWVGAVLAFYFSKDNLQAASQTTLDAFRAAGGVDVEEQVTSVMTPLNRIRPREDVATKAAAGSLKLSDLRSKMSSSGLTRVPVFVTGAALYVVHDTDLDKYAQSKGVSTTAFVDADTVTAALSDSSIAKAFSTFAAVPGTATVIQARAALAGVPEAKDVFVTDDGKTTGKVLGWLTNSDLARLS